MGCECVLRHRLQTFLLMAPVLPAIPHAFRTKGTFSKGNFYEASSRNGSSQYVTLDIFQLAQLSAKWLRLVPFGIFTFSRGSLVLVETVRSCVEKNLIAYT